MSDAIVCPYCNKATKQGNVVTGNDGEKIVICSSSACAEQHMIYEYQTSGKLTTKLIQNKVLNKYNHRPDLRDRIHADDQAIYRGIYKFECTVWCPLLQSYVEEAADTSHVMETPNVQVSLNIQDHHVFLTLCSPDAEIFLTIEGYVRGLMNLSAIRATKNEALDLIQECITFVQKHGLQFHPEKEAVLSE